MGAQMQSWPLADRNPKSPCLGVEWKDVSKNHSDDFGRYFPLVLR
jgi:hypothetical protein